MVRFLWVLLCLAHWAAAAALSPGALQHLPPHPRLFANAARWQQLREQVKTDAISAELFAALCRQADAYLPQPVIEYRVPSNEKLGCMREARRRIGTLAGAALLTADARYRERALEEMRALASLGDWNPQHFLDTGEATAALAFGYDWLFNQMTPKDRALCEWGIIQNGLQPSISGDKKHLDWVSGTNNWNQVCHGGLVIGALAIAEADPELCQHVIERAVTKLHHAAEQYAPDGNYPEGPMYWGYGTTYHVLLLDALRTALGSTLGLEKFPGFMESVDWYSQMVGPTGRFFNYSDCVEYPTFHPVALWFARELHRPDLWNQQMELLRKPEAKYELLTHALIWRQPAALPVKAPARPLAWIGHGQMPVATFRSAWDDPHAVFVGMKGGSPNHSHAHMDEGSFVLEADGVRWAVDPGMQDYDSLQSRGINLFDAREARWKVFRLGPEAHSIIRFDHGWQKVSNFGALGAARLTGSSPLATADLSPLYTSWVSRVRRGISLHQDRRVFLRDEWIAGSEYTHVAWQWMTYAEAHADATGVSLQQDGQSLRLQVAAADKFWISVEDASRPAHAFDTPNPGLKRIVVRTETYAWTPGWLAVVAEPGSATGTLEAQWAAKPLADW